LKPGCILSVLLGFYGIKGLADDLWMFVPWRNSGGTILEVGVGAMRLFLELRPDKELQ